MKKLAGSKGFEEHYWSHNYSKPKEMDGIGNVKNHVGYLKNLLELDFIDVSSVIDFGFGLGHLFKAILKEFKPYKASGIEPSEHVFKKTNPLKLKPVSSMKLSLYQTDIVTWCQERAKKEKRFDLGICTSVFQYLSEDEINYIIPILAQKVKYLYFSVPTDKELKRQRDDLEFTDPYAISRSRTFYLKAFKAHFTVVSARLLESKVHNDEKTSPFTDLLFRF